MDRLSGNAHRLDFEGDTLRNKNNVRFKSTINHQRRCTHYSESSVHFARNTQLKPKVPNRKSFWNKIPDQERNKVVELALEKTELSPKELAFYITDTQGWFISESSVYRILKKRDLITGPVWILMAAADEFKDNSTYVKQQWQN